MPRQRHYRNTAGAGETIFLTTTVLDFVPVFRDPQLAAIAVTEMARVCRETGAVLHAYVIMPDHMHLVLRLPTDQTASDFAARLKSIIARAIRPELDLTMQYRFSQQVGLNHRQ